METGGPGYARYFLIIESLKELIRLYSRHRPLLLHCGLFTDISPAVRVMGELCRSPASMYDDILRRSAAELARIYAGAAGVVGDYGVLRKNIETWAGVNDPFFRLYIAGYAVSVYMDGATGAGLPLPPHGFFRAIAAVAEKQGAKTGIEDVGGLAGFIEEKCYPISSWLPLHEPLPEPKYVDKCFEAITSLVLDEAAANIIEYYGETLRKLFLEETRRRIAEAASRILGKKTVVIMEPGELASAQLGGDEIIVYDNRVVEDSLIPINLYTLPLLGKNSLYERWLRSGLYERYRVIRRQLLRGSWLYSLHAALRSVDKKLFRGHMVYCIDPRGDKAFIRIHHPVEKSIEAARDTVENICGRRASGCIRRLSTYIVGKILAE